LFLQAQWWAIPFFFLACIARVLVFVPAMPLLIAGLVFIEPPLLLLLTTTGFLVASTLIYSGSHWLGLDATLEARYPAKLRRLKLALEQHGSWIVFLWAFLPLVPTDLISYAAGTTRMPFGRFLICVTAGQILLAFIIAFGGSALLPWLF
jgi:uncharacterized membrane protein YdjX (TVP38/TMEM64 family)